MEKERRHIETEEEKESYGGEGHGRAFSHLHKVVLPPSQRGILQMNELSDMQASALRKKGYIYTHTYTHIHPHLLV